MNIVLANPYASDEARGAFKESPDTGLCSQIHPSNKDFWAAVRAMFHCDETEEVCGVNIKEDGSIMARFRRIPILKRKPCSQR